MTTHTAIMHLFMLAIGIVPLLWTLNLEREKDRYDDESAE
jgi:hypothetical protein